MSLMEPWRKEIIDAVQKKWGFLESDDIKVQQLITQVCILTMVKTERKLKPKIDFRKVFKDKQFQQVVRKMRLRRNRFEDKRFTI